jgi:hypothetical protein
VANAPILELRFAEERDPETPLRLILRNLIVELPEQITLENIFRAKQAGVAAQVWMWMWRMRGYCGTVHLREPAGKPPGPAPAHGDADRVELKCLPETGDYRGATSRQIPAPSTGISGCRRRKSGACSGYG